MIHTLSLPFSGTNETQGFFDAIAVYPSGDLVLEGWYLDKVFHEQPVILIDGAPQPINSCYRYPRRDVHNIYKESPIQSGFRMVVRLQPAHCKHTKVEVVWRAQTIAGFEADFTAVHPDMCSWVSQSKQVYHRDDMYAEGPPSKVATRDVVDLFDPITESALDFGCGIGLYMKELQAKGINCRGIELDRPDIRNNIPEDQKEHITLYDGKFPLPFHDKEFEVSICSEVLEHIPNYKEALAELSRVTRKCVIITVPDIGVVDFLSRNFIIPFHMLEPTHLNFFNEFSLLETVEPYFSGRKELYKICPVVTNGLTWFSSLALIAYQE